MSRQENIKMNIIQGQVQKTTNGNSEVHQREENVQLINQGRLFRVGTHI